MSSRYKAFDFTGDPSTRVQSAAFQALRSLGPGEKVLLILAQEPTLMMRSLDLQLRRNLAWNVVEVDGRWQVEVSHRADAEPRDAVDLLERDHKHLDGLLVQALQQLNRGLVEGAAPLLDLFARATRRHMAVEDDVLAPILVAGRSASGNDPLSIMLRDHVEIRQQLAVIEGALVASEVGELSAYCAILSGTLAKHEHREENNLFPQWRIALGGLRQPERDELLARTGAALRPQSLSLSSRERAARWPPS